MQENLIPYKNMMITYLKPLKHGAYGSTEVTERGFYSDLFNRFTIPPEWRMFNGVLLPHGFGGIRLKEHEIIKWEYIN